MFKFLVLSSQPENLKCFQFTKYTYFKMAVVTLEGDQDRENFVGLRKTITSVIYSLSSELLDLKQIDGIACSIQTFQFLTVVV